MPVIREDFPGFTDRVDESTVQVYSAETIVNALHVAIVPRKSRINIDRLDPELTSENGHVKSEVLLRNESRT